MTEGDQKESRGGFDAELLTGDGKWWEFLDPDTYQVKEGLPTATRSTSDQLDWSRARKRKTPGPVGFSFFNLCTDCGRGVPPDFTFCVHCGGFPRSIDPVKTHSIVIASFDNDQAIEAATELITKSGADLGEEEVQRIFQAPPAVFNVTARRDQIAALTAKLAEVGIRARAFDVDDPSVPWIRETFESLARSWPKLGAVAVVVLTTLFAALQWSWFFFPIGLLALGAVYVRELRWYRGRYHVDVHRMLELVTGFDEETASVARDTLRRLRAGKVREYVTICLMEYYTLTQQLRAHSTVYGAVLERARQSLEELMADVLALAHRCAKLDEFVAANPPAAIKQRIDELEQREETGTRADEMAKQELAALRQQLADTARMEESRETFRERLKLLASSMEQLRSRISAVRSRPSEEAWRQIHIEEALEELDEEFEIFEETFEVVQ